MKLKNKFVEKQFNDINTNGGFPEGMTLKDFESGALVETQWNDSENLICYILDIEKHAYNFKGGRHFTGLFIGTDNLSSKTLKCDHTQIAAFLAPSFNLLKKYISYDETLLAIDQLAQGTNNATLIKICELVSSAL